MCELPRNVQNPGTVGQSIDCSTVHEREKMQINPNQIRYSFKRKKM